MIGTLLVAATCICGTAPEREMDFYWENDLVGFRAYGPKDAHCWSGIDLFVKKVSTNAVVHLLRHNRKEFGNWHLNKNPLAFDDYTIGASRGCGAVALWADGEWKTYPNWEKATVIHEGDDYLEFELVYPSFSAMGKMKYHITMKAGDNFFRNDVSFERPKRMAKGWKVGPGLFPDPKCSAKPFVRTLPGEEGKVEKLKDHLGSEILAFKTPSFSYIAGFESNLTPKPNK